MNGKVLNLFVFIGQLYTKYDAKTTCCALCTLLVYIGTGDSGRAGDCTNTAEQRMNKCFQI